MKIFELEQIRQSISLANDLEELLALQRAVFIDYTAGLYDVPLPIQFSFPEYHSDCHIKAAYKQGSSNLVVKIANGNPFGGNGVILIFSAQTGELKAILHDEGFLTTLRTAIAGIIASELIPWQIQNIGIIGSGNLAKMLYDLVSIKYPTKHSMLYARNSDKALSITKNIYGSAQELVANSDLIFTATSSENPIIHDIAPNSNKAIIALGSDDEHKRELAIGLFKESNVIIIDSKQQALKFGDVAKAIASGAIYPDSLTELGNALKSGIPQDSRKIIADFSGIAAQDFAMTEFVVQRFLQ